MNYEIVIGLEVHVQLDTASKMFCGCGTEFGAPPNTQVCPVCLGFPGVLPVINEKAITLSMMTALALNCQVAKFTKFDRKHYYYPDLPKNFQISQYDKPLSQNGFLDIVTDGRAKRIGIKRIHLEEDAGKLIHQEASAYSVVDYNRAGMPLLEIVTDPDLRSPEEAYEYLTDLKAILEYLGVSNCNMEEGRLRCDANISIRPQGETALGTKVELKNMNSFKGVRQALEFESKRQIDQVTEGGKIVQETRLWDADRQVSNSMRTKEDAHDYRYFPEPDLMPITPTDDQITRLREQLPELPKQRRERFKAAYDLSDYDAGVLTSQKALADLFEVSLKHFNRPKIAANWIMGDLLAVLSSADLSIGKTRFNGEDLAGMLSMIEDSTISGKMAKELLKESVLTGKRPIDIVKEKGISQISDEKAIQTVIEKVLAANPKAVEDYRAGKESAVTFLVGQAMRETKGKANPAMLNTLLRRQLNERK